MIILKDERAQYLVSMMNYHLNSNMIILKVVDGLGYRDTKAQFKFQYDNT